MVIIFSPNSLRVRTFCCLCGSLITRHLCLYTFVISFNCAVKDITLFINLLNDETTMAQDGVYVFDSASRNNSGISDVATIAALSGGNGFGGMNNPFWMMFMWPLMYPFMNMFGGNGWGNGWGNGNNGTGFIANQLNNDVGRDVILQAINGRADALAQLAQMTNSDINSVRDAIGIVSTKIAEVGGQVGMSGLQVINAIQSGNATLAQQLCNCCCENRLETVNQTNALQSQAATNASNAQLQLANHDANVRLQLAQNEAADQLSVCQQTNQLGSQADRNLNTTLGAIAALQTNITKEFCDIRERELQDKVDTLTAQNTNLRGQIDNANQTAAITGYVNSQLAPIQAQVNKIAAKQPNTVPVEYPNISAVNNTPYAGGFGYPFGFGFGNNFGWGGSFWG